MQVRRQVPVHPGVEGLGRHRHRPPGRGGEAPHQLGLHVAVDVAVLVAVERYAREPALVLLEPEQRAGEVEQHSIDVSHATIVPGVKYPLNG